ncbi:DNA polymerase III subunit delta', partial [Salmonella enterica subsp. enterica]|nr:DNA polymerase III subunit delta' [Salmonella enterica subsp. enterica]
FHLANYLISGAKPGALDPQSAAFRQIAMGAHPAVLHLTRPFDDKTKKFKTVLSVAEVRRVSKFLSMTVHDGGWRVVVVDPADDLSVSAANALLKNLEEPPARTLFILIAHQPGALLPTIRSRTQTVRLQPLSASDLTSALAGVEDMPELNADALQILWERSGGSVRQAILLTQHGGLEISSEIDKLTAAPTLDIASAHKLAEAVSGRDKATAFALFNDHALQLLADAAAKSALNRDLDRAGRLSAAWQDARMAISETETYNLDQKQHALSMIARLNAIFRM